MSYPILYAPTETKFDHNGFGILVDCVSCVVIEEANGAFELEMQYPMDGIHYSDIADRCLIKSKPNQEAEPQLFRVYSISKPMSGIVSVYAEHISYDLSGIPVSNFSATNASSAMTGLLQNAVIPCPFTFMTDKSTIANFSVSAPGSIRSKLGGVRGSILDVYGGEYEFDNYKVILHNSRGKNRGVSIRYGKNLTDIKQDRNCASIATGVYPYWTGDVDGKTVLIELPEKIVNATETYNFTKIRMLDLSGEFETQPTVDELRAKAESYVKENNIGVPNISLTVSFSQLEQTEEYKHLKLLERVNLFDTVNVEFPALGVSATAKAVQIVYNVILDRVENITLGSVRSKITDTVANQQQQISQAPTKDYVQKASAAATAWLTNGKGYKVERVDDNGNTIDTLYMDTPDINAATNVLRIGQSGIGFSRSGVNGPYYSAWTLDGTFDASVVNVINLIAQAVRSVSKNSQLDINGSSMFLQTNGIGRTFSVYNYADGEPRMYMVSYDENGKEVSRAQFGSWLLGLGGTDINNPLFAINASGDTVKMSISNSGMKTLSWKNNGDGTYTLIGS